MQVDSASAVSSLAKPMTHPSLGIVRMGSLTCMGQSGKDCQVQPGIGLVHCHRSSMTIRGCIQLFQFCSMTPHA